MSLLHAGMGANLSAIKRRVETVERFFGGLQREVITTPNGKYEVLAAPFGLGSDSGGRGPFCAYLADDKKMAVWAGRFITDVANGTEKQVTGSGEWFALTAATRAWIKVTINSDLTAGAAQIETGTTSPYPLVGFTGGVETVCYVPIGSVMNGSLPDAVPGFEFQLTSGANAQTYHFEQKIQTNLFLALMVIDGKAAVYPLPFAG